MFRLLWNYDEGRLRAPWRIVAHAILFAIALVVATMVVAPMAGGILGSAAGPITYGDLSEISQSNLGAMAWIGLAMLVAGVVSTWTAARHFDHRRFADLGLHLNADWWADLGFGLLLGAGLMTLIFLIELAAGWVNVVDMGLISGGPAAFIRELAAAIVLFISVGIYEELITRGYQLRNLAEGLNTRLWGAKGAVVAALVVTSLIFGLLHMPNPGRTLLAFVNISLNGITVLGAAYVLTGRLALPIGVHITWNFVQGTVFGFAVSGAQYGQFPFFITEQLGPELWTGGAFGPEAGLLCTLVNVAGLIAIVVWARDREGAAAVKETLARPDEITPDVPEPLTQDAAGSAWPDTDDTESWPLE